MFDNEGGGEGGEGRATLIKVKDGYFDFGSLSRPGGDNFCPFPLGQVAKIIRAAMCNIPRNITPF